MGLKEIDTNIGQNYISYVCDDCKEKIRIESEKLSKWDLIRPRKTAEKFRRLICKDCHNKIRGAMGE